MKQTALSCVCMTALWVCLSVIGHCEAGPFRISNGFISLAGEGAAITDLRFDAGGKGRFGENLLGRLEFEGLVALPECEWRREGDELLVGGLELRVAQDLEIGNAHIADMLQPGHVLGQSFKLDAGVFTSVAIRIPTWHSDDSGATLRLRRGGPEGEVIASRKLEGILDNSFQRLEFPPQPAGEYIAELAEPVGTPGWWSCEKDEYAGGAAYLDGKPLSGRDRSLQVRASRPAGPARLRLTLTERDLSIAVELLPGSEPHSSRLKLQLPWDNTGYDVSAQAIPFKRFYTDNQRYLPAEQFKRAESPGLSFAGCRWMEADGTGDYDLRFSGHGLAVSWGMKPDTATLHITSRQRETEDGCWANAVKLTVLPRDDALPEEWPAFETPDAALTEDLNRLLYERAFSYPAPCGPAPWQEWSATIRFWFAGPLHDGEVAGLRGTPVTDEGYVHTWGGEAGWPFPDPKKYDTRHFDTNARFILACRRHVCWTRDEKFLRGQAERLRRAMNYQLTALKGEDGLIISASKDVNGRHEGVGNNYWDILPFGHLDAFANAVYYASLEAMAEIEMLLEALPDLETETANRPSGFYRQLAEKVKSAYNAAFWDEEKGRYIGCIDVDGKRHDYGFTFVNLEAMAYGLASKEQARRIYDWLEHGKSSTGEADIYSRWVFAPRATTIHNPMWNKDGVNDPHTAGVEPWWFFGWRGTPFGDQCQDGGAIFYTSFFDLMARSRLLGPERAWARWEEILARYREPDRLCGGPPLFRGEHPQQAMPGSVGLDIPFPESGLVPTWFLYGLAGVEATAEGLVIAPDLPDVLPWLTIRNISYRNLPLDLRVTSRSVELTSRLRGYECTWRREIEPGGRVVFRQPPPPVEGFPSKPEPVSAWRGRWIWGQGDAEQAQRIHLRKTFDLNAKPDAARVVVTADNTFKLFINGTQALQGDNWQRLYRLDVAGLLQPGKNVIAVEAQNAGGAAGVLLEGVFSVGDDSIRVFTDRAWRVSETAPEGWRLPAFDDATWQPARDLGRPPVGPWGDIGEPGL